MAGPRLVLVGVTPHYTAQRKQRQVNPYVFAGSARLWRHVGATQATSSDAAQRANQERLIDPATREGAFMAEIEGGLVELLARPPTFSERVSHPSFRSHAARSGRPEKHRRKRMFSPATDMASASGARICRGICWQLPYRRRAELKPHRLIATPRRGRDDAFNTTKIA
jgi:hypothetical protein